MGEIHRFITIKIAGNSYGLNILEVQAIIKNQKVMKARNPSDMNMSRMITLQNEAIPVYNLHKMLDIDYCIENCEYLIVLREDKTVIAFPVDNVEKIIDIPEDQLKELPIIFQNGEKYIHSIAICNKQIIMILSCRQLMDILSNQCKE